MPPLSFKRKYAVQIVLILVTPQLLMLKIIFPISVICVLVLNAGFKCWVFLISLKLQTLKTFWILCKVLSNTTKKKAMFKDQVNF